MTEDKRIQTVLTTLNAKYIHTSLALRWLYVVNKDRFDLDVKEYTIKEDRKTIAREILSTDCDVVGISVSIWNVQQSKELVALLKEQKPQLLIVLGGPEVSYEPEFFLHNWEIDFVISGEGEFVLGDLLQAIQEGSVPPAEGISSRRQLSTTVARADVERLSAFPSPYQLEGDLPHLQNRLVYFETSRGCPYQCQYCLSSLEKGVRYFPQSFIADNLRYLIDNKAKQIKFLDRTFNLNQRHTSFVFDFLLKHYRPHLSCQFEIYADLLDDATIARLNETLPRHFFRFEIGIQSTYEPTNIAVKRKQDFPLLAENIKKLREGAKIDLHLDLIAGLPHETYERFARSFNDVFALGAKEVQLGFLKLLRGTNLRKEAGKYGYQYNREAPYEIYCNRDISQKELERIHDAEHALEKFWNSGRFSQTMHYLFTHHYEGKYFELFDEIGRFYLENDYPHHGYQLEDLFRYLHRFLLSKGIDSFVTLRNDYYGNFTLRPQGFWDDRMEKQKRKRLLYTIGQDKVFLKEHQLDRKTIEKQTAIDPIAENRYLLTVFLGEKRLQIEYRECAE